MINVICFGAAGGGERLFDKVIKRVNILAFTDNDEKKWGGSIKSVPILSVEEALNLKYDRIIITSAPGKDSIIGQLIGYGISEDKIDTTYIDGPLEARIIYLEKLAEMQKNIANHVQVAEAGVFAGDFAKWINYYYSDRNLHLFDTFEGFNENDLEYEKGKSDAKKGDYSNTSESIVISKMPYKDKVSIHKGYFPQSASNLEGEFCFVNLDLDLYEPTYAGLNLFSRKMVKNGVILVHDYFATNFKGPKLAVDRFIEENSGKYRAFPMGDGISVMVIGF